MSAKHRDPDGTPPSSGGPNRAELPAERVPAESAPSGITEGGWAVSTIDPDAQGLLDVRDLAVSFPGAPFGIQRTTGDVRYPSAVRPPSAAHMSEQELLNDCD